MPRRPRWFGLVLAVAAAPCLGACVRAAEPPALLELSTPGRSVRGRLVARNDDVAWLLDPAGRLDRIALDDVVSFRRTAGRFSATRPAALRDRLAKQLGLSYETLTTRHYVVAAPTGLARRYAVLLENIRGAFSAYFRLRRFEVPDPEFPLVAVVLRDRAAFLDYCRRRESAVSARVGGVYFLRSNHLALYATDDAEAGAEFAAAGVLVHEATHQLAFNCGLHSRLGANPLWVVEGLAMYFEPAGVREGSRRDAPATRINRGRYADFQTLRKTSARERPLATFLVDDAPFRAASADAYARAWALTFFLVETRPRRYGDYLRTIAQRDPLAAYPAQARLADFKRFFGRDLDVLQVAFHRFLDEHGP